ncbi:helix-turn-helix domain-containing protein [Streptomyces tubbatahanensis]|uniref:Helix-turn-helix domain-containing protein n=1 Tax=Streptomyces tubbatahanensis TaxID=2923272 RepID=A0ABY3Y0I6_9ACTN|nr:helix-turn-helix transcriptional regulator [Streptomyces tubbatahanensis]UNT00094.1 helix-turn-helix domain-containing protein [Streptomyces tubbatahanensis]
MRISDVSGGEPTARDAEQDGGEEGTAASPAVPRKVLGIRLRRLRESQYISRREAAEAIRVTNRKIEDLEHGRTGCALRDVADLLTIYGVTDESERAVLTALAQQANAPGWWQAFQGVVPSWLHTYIGLEQAAGVIRTYEVQFVPGLLQTREYARAVIELAHEEEPESAVQRRVDLRMRRQQILFGPRSPRVWAVIDEAALRRPVGGAAVMRAQLRHLSAMSEQPHVTVQIMPFSAGGHAAAGGPVTLLRLPESELPDVVYLEQLDSASYLEDETDIEAYRRVTDRLVTRSLPPAETRGLLRRIAAELPDTEPTATLAGHFPVH